MTSSLHKAIKQVLKEVDNFLTSTLRDQTLNKAVQKERTKLIDSLQRLYNDFDEIKPTPEKGETRTNPTPTLLRIGSQPSEDSCSNEYNITQTTVSALKQPTMNGYLFQRKLGDREQKLFKQKKNTKKYCVVHENIMYWFIKPSDKNFHGAVYLNECKVEDVSRKDKEFIFQLLFPSNCDSYEFQADNKEDLKEWMKAVDKGIQCGKQKKEDEENAYPFDGMSTATTSGEVTYMNEMPDHEEGDSVYWEPDSINSSTKNIELQSSKPHQRPPISLPNRVIDDAKLPFPPKTGKALKESKPAKTKQIDKVAPESQEKHKKSSLPNDSKTSPKNKQFVPSSQAKPKTLNEVKFKPVSVPEYTDDGDIYETVDNVASGAGDARGLSVPASKPPQLPRDNNLYVNEPDSDNLIYEIAQ